MSESDSSALAKDRIRVQRDRFLAFAFAGGDLLVELDGDGRVVFATGAAERVCGRAPEGLAGAGFLDLVHADDRTMAAEALRRLHGGGRFSRLRLLLDDRGTAVQALVSGINLGGAAGCVHLSISRDHRAAAPRPKGPVSSAGFAEMAESRLREGLCSGEAYSLTLVNVPANDSAGDELLATLESGLRAWSVGGDSVARLENGTVGIIHDGHVDGTMIQARLQETLKAFDHDELPGLRLATMTMDADLAAEDVSKALVYVVNKFAERAEGFSLSSLTQGYKAAMSETMSKVQNFRALIGGEQFCFAFQPIVCLTNWNVHHFEALARIAQGGRHVLPARFIGFAEDMGVVAELDWIVCRKALTVLRDNAGIPPAAHVAINLSGASLTNVAFVNQLIRLLRENSWQLPRLLFELTESAGIKDLEAANKVVQKLRGMGCRFCLDDFGAGAATFHYLRALEVDYVKIDGSYILDAFDSRHGKPFLRAMVSLCNELGIRTIGEMVEEERAIHLLRELRVDYAQGFFFAKPSVDATKLPLPPKPFGRVQAHLAVGMT